MKKQLTISLIVSSLLCCQSLAFAEEKVTVLNLFSGETEEITLSNNTIEIQGIGTFDEELAERFEYNGRYYPQAYWLGNDYDDAKENFTHIYNTILYKNNDGTLKTWTYKNYLTQKREDEFLYEAITKDILKKYPILTNGTDKQKKERQLQQMLELNKWFVNNSDYGKHYFDYLLQDKYNMYSLISGQLTTTENVKYGELKIDNVVSKEYRDNVMFETEFNPDVDTIKYMNEYFRYHNMRLEGGLSMHSYLKGRNVKFTAVCHGYSRITKMVANQMGIDAQEVASETHAWTVVRFSDGSIMHFDETQADEGFQSLYILVDGLKTDSRIGDVVRTRATSVKSSDERLYKLMGGNSQYPKEIRKSKTVPMGDVLEVFGHQTKWTNFYNAFHSGSQM